MKAQYVLLRKNTCLINLMVTLVRYLIIVMNCQYILTINGNSTKRKTKIALLFSGAVKLIAILINSRGNCSNAVSMIIVHVVRHAKAPPHYASAHSKCQPSGVDHIWRVYRGREKKRFTMPQILGER